MRTLAASCIIVGVVFAAASDQPNPPKSDFSTWIYPDSKWNDFFEASETGKTDNAEQTVGFSRGQYETRESFGDVVAFYIKKSGLRIQGKDLEQFEFPSDNVFPPAGASQVDAKGKAVNVTLASNIQRTAATVTILVTNHPDNCHRKGRWMTIAQRHCGFVWFPRHHPPQNTQLDSSIIR